MAADADDTRPAAPGIRPMRGSLRRFPADADDARPTVHRIRPIPGSSCSLLLVLRPGKGTMRLKRSPADADDARLAVSAIRPMTELSGGAPVPL